MSILGKVFVGAVAVMFWLFANGFWEMSGAPEHFTTCQSADWAIEQNAGKFRPDEWLALKAIKLVGCPEA